MLVASSCEPIPCLFGGAVVECLTRDQGAAGSSLTGVTALWSSSKTGYPSLLLVQPRKTRPCLTERLLMGCKKSNQTNKQNQVCSNYASGDQKMALSQMSHVLFVEVLHPGNFVNMTHVES